MVKKIIFISLLVFMMSCSAIGRGIFLDSIIKGAVRDFEKEQEDEKKQDSHSKSVTKENGAANKTDSDEEDDDEEEVEEIK
ncbi:hypothetical protein QIA41_04785 (plasmid) [Borreliella sinica]|uniref:hypothetical protein n=1 Tax=Borreliella sinica TaxID=87162 RepID=UPI002A24D60E|nr:hypothetical protein [Borreliella sinica]WPM06412.1 hypothetical protein QIA41_04785 [Borreliella sinica]